MAGNVLNSGSWKAKFLHGMAEYVFNAIYLALIFAAFSQYRSCLLYTSRCV